MKNTFVILFLKIKLCVSKILIKSFRRLTEHMKAEGYVLVFRLLFLVNKTTTVYLKDSIFVLVFTPQDNLKDETYVLVFRILFLENKTTSLPKRFNNSSSF